MKFLLIEDTDDHAEIAIHDINVEWPMAEILRYKTLGHARLEWEKLKDQHQEFLAIVLDLTLPDSTRAETIEFIRNVKNNLPIVVYSGAEIAPSEVPDKKIFFVQKPDGENRLIEILRQIYQGSLAWKQSNK